MTPHEYRCWALLQATTWALRLSDMGLIDRTEMAYLHDVYAQVFFRVYGRVPVCRGAFR